MVAPDSYNKNKKYTTCYIDDKPDATALRFSTLYLYGTWLDQLRREEGAGDQEMTLIDVTAQGALRQVKEDNALQWWRDAAGGRRPLVCFVPQEHAVPYLSPSFSDNPRSDTFPRYCKGRHMVHSLWPVDLRGFVGWSEADGFSGTTQATAEDVNDGYLIDPEGR